MGQTLFKIEPNSEQFYIVCVDACKCHKQRHLNDILFKIFLYKMQWTDFFKVKKSFNFLGGNSEKNGMNDAFNIRKRKQTTAPQFAAAYL